MTIRKTTERPSTTTLGTNTLIPGLNAETILGQFEKISQIVQFDAVIPPLWDGNAAPRIVASLWDNIKND